eukprot:4653095-Ditylum_brightwellii.AAC.1
MANDKAPGTNSITSDALKSMVWTEQDPGKEEDSDDANYLVSVVHTADSGLACLILSSGNLSTL